MPEETCSRPNRVTIIARASGVRFAAAPYTQLLTLLSLRLYKNGMAVTPHAHCQIVGDRRDCDSNAWGDGYVANRGDIGCRMLALYTMLRTNLSDALYGRGCPAAPEIPTLAQGPRKSGVSGSGLLDLVLKRTLDHALSETGCHAAACAVSRSLLKPSCCRSCCHEP
jgi:hypothetical protein